MANAAGQVLSIVVAGLAGWRFFPASDLSQTSHMRFPIGKRLGLGTWMIFFLLLLGLPLVRQAVRSHGLEVFDSFFRVGSLVFGGGHVVLPLLQAEVVGPGWG